MKLRQALNELKLKDKDKVFIYVYGKKDSAKEPLQVADINASLLKREVMFVQPHQGGKKHKYNLYQFVVR